MKKVIATIASSLLVCLFAISAQATPIFINEIHYDNAGGDVSEGVEIAGPADTDLSSWNIVLYNGSSSQLKMYKTFDLQGVLPDQQNGFGVLSFQIADIQNGSPDGIGLVNETGALVQFLSYEGTFIPIDGPAAGQISTDIGIFEPDSTPIGYSMQLSGTGTDSLDFSWDLIAMNSMGEVNQSQIFSTAEQELEPDSAAPVPEPSTLIMLVCGFTLMAGLKKSRS